MAVSMAASLTGSCAATLLCAGQYWHAPAAGSTACAGSAGKGCGDRGVTGCRGWQDHRENVKRVAGCEFRQNLCWGIRHHRQLPVCDCFSAHDNPALSRGNCTCSKGVRPPCGIGAAQAAVSEGLHSDRPQGCWFAGIDPCARPLQLAAALTAKPYQVYDKFFPALKMTCGVGVGSPNLPGGLCGVECLWDLMTTE